MTNYEIMAAVNIFGRKVFVRVDETYTDWMGTYVINNGFSFPIWTSKDDLR